MKIVSEVGTVLWMRSSHQPPECACCDGPHVFCRTTEEDWSTVEFIRNAIHRLPEGAKFRITVETI